MLIMQPASRTTGRSARVRRRPIDIISRILDSTGLLNGTIRALGGRYIMAYHRVLSPTEALLDWCHPAIWLRPETLDAHLRFFSRIGRIVPLDDLLTAQNPSEPLFSITFDDAWIDSFTHALPVLNAHKASACFFVPTDAVSTGRLFWTEEVALKLGEALLGPRAPDLIAHLGWPPRIVGSTQALLPPLMEYIEQLKELPKQARAHTIDSLYERFEISPEPVQGRVMNWEQIRSLAASGHTIGSHSKTHLILRNVETEKIDEELVESKQIIEQYLACPVNYFCFPNARYDAVSSQRVLAAGYTHGFRIHNLKVTQAQNSALVPRFSASETNSYPAFLKVRLVRASLQ